MEFKNYYFVESKQLDEGIGTSIASAIGRKIKNVGRGIMGSKKHTAFNPKWLKVLKPFDAATYKATLDFYSNAQMGRTKIGQKKNYMVTDMMYGDVNSDVRDELTNILVKEDPQYKDIDLDAEIPPEISVYILNNGGKVIFMQLPVGADGKKKRYAFGLNGPAEKAFSFIHGKSFADYSMKLSDEAGKSEDIDDMPKKEISADIFSKLIPNIVADKTKTKQKAESFSLFDMFDSIMITEGAKRKPTIYIVKKGKKSWANAETGDPIELDPSTYKYRAVSKELAKEAQKSEDAKKILSKTTTLAADPQKEAQVEFDTFMTNFKPKQETDSALDNQESDIQEILKDDKNKNAVYAMRIALATINSKPKNKKAKYEALVDKLKDLKISVDDIDVVAKYLNDNKTDMDATIDSDHLKTVKAKGEDVKAKGEDVSTSTTDNTAIDDIPEFLIKNVADLTLDDVEIADYLKSPEKLLAKMKIDKSVADDFFKHRDEQITAQEKEEIEKQLEKRAFINLIHKLAGKTFEYKGEERSKEQIDKDIADARKRIADYYDEETKKANLGNEEIIKEIKPGRTLEELIASVQEVSTTDTITQDVADSISAKFKENGLDVNGINGVVDALNNKIPDDKPKIKPVNKSLLDKLVAFVNKPKTEAPGGTEDKAKTEAPKDGTEDKPKTEAPGGTGDKTEEAPKDGTRDKTEEAPKTDAKKADATKKAKEAAPQSYGTAYENIKQYMDVKPIKISTNPKSNIVSGYSYPLKNHGVMHIYKTKDNKHFVSYDARGEQMLKFLGI